MTFIPNENAVKKAGAELRKPAHGGIPTLEDAIFTANQHKWVNEPGSNSFIFWQAVYDYLCNQRGTERKLP